MICLQYRDSLSHLEIDDRDYAIRKIQSLIGENISGEEELRTLFYSLFRILRQIFQVSFQTLCMVYSIALCSSNMPSKFLKKRFFSLENKDIRESTAEFSSYRKRNKRTSQRQSLRNRRTLAPVNTPKMRHVYGRGEALVQLVAACCCATSPLSRRRRQKNTVIRRESMKIGLR